MKLQHYFQMLFDIFMQLNSIFFSFIVFLTSFSLTNACHSQWHFFEGEAFTTKVDFAFWLEDSTTVKTVHNKIFHEFERIDKLMSRYRDDSELSRINRLAFSETIHTSDELFRLIAQARSISQLSKGAFDITFASVGVHYDYRAQQQPSEKQLSDGRQINYNDIVLDAKTKTIRYARQDLVIDLGGIAKGYAIDRAIEIMQVNGIHHGRISAGGDLRLLNDKRGKPWIVAVKDPRQESGQAVTLPLAAVAMSTSGDYERYFIDESGERIHHILSPKTGRPAQGVQSVSVIGPDATTTDALSTALFVMGVEQGLALANALPGIDAIFIDNQRKMHFSEGLSAPKK